MGEPLDSFLFDEALTPAQRRRVEAALAADPDLAAAVARWQALCAALRQRLDDAVPNRHLLVCYALEDRAGVLDPAEQAALDAARADLERALKAHPGLRDVVWQIRADADAFEAVWEAHQGPALRDRAPRPPARRAARRWVGRLGLLAVLVVFATALTLLWQRDRSQTTVAAAPGQVRLVTLADGSTVRLVDGARLRYAAGDFDRRLRLDGRAFFDVTHDPAHPFTVETATALTTVLGTRFGVQAGDDGTEVVLVSGRVTLAPRTDRTRFVVLEPGQRSRVAAGAGAEPPAAVDVAEALAWTNLLIFRETPLEAIAGRLTAAYQVPVHVAPALAAEPVSGTFDRTRPLDEILQALAATLGADVRPQGDGFRLVPRP